MTVVASTGQRFTVSHLNEADLKTAGLRSYSSYRDLGIAMATNGPATAHAIRMIAPFAESFSELLEVILPAEHPTFIDE